MPVMLDTMNINVNKTIKIAASLLVGLTTKLVKNGLVTDSNKDSSFIFKKFRTSYIQLMELTLLNSYNHGIL